MNILSHWISQVLHRKQMAYSNWDYLRRFNLQRNYFQRCRQSVRKPNRMCRNLELGAAWLLASPSKRGWGEGKVMIFQKEKGAADWQGARTCPKGHPRPLRESTRTINALTSFNSLPPTSCQNSLISRTQMKIQGHRKNDWSWHLSVSWEKSKWARKTE